MLICCLFIFGTHLLIIVSVVNIFVGLGALTSITAIVSKLKKQNSLQRMWRVMSLQHEAVQACLCGVLKSHEASPC